MSNAFKRLVPLFNRVLIEKVVAPTKSVGGILLPESAVPQLNQGTVIAIGSQVSEHVKVGDKVLLPEFNGTTIKLQEKQFQLYREDDILGVLKKD